MRRIDCVMCIAENDDCGTLANIGSWEDVMPSKGFWVMPRTRVGQIGAGVTVATILWATIVGATGFVLVLVIISAMGIVWTAILRHGDAALVLWVLAMAGSGWLFLTIIR
jgi:hypothetical protein